MSWNPVCRLDDLPPERAVAALLPGGVQVAVVRLHDGSVHAVSHRDPRSGAHVMARGIVGNRGLAPTLTSPLHKEVYDLRTGGCLDDPGLALAVHAVRVERGRVLVGVPLIGRAMAHNAPLTESDEP